MSNEPINYEQFLKKNSDNEVKIRLIKDRNSTTAFRQDLQVEQVPIFDSQGNPIKDENGAFVFERKLTQVNIPRKHGELLTTDLSTSDIFDPRAERAINSLSLALTNAVYFDEHFKADGYMVDMTDLVEHLRAMRSYILLVQKSRRTKEKKPFYERVLGVFEEVTTRNINHDNIRGNNNE
jgi:hypothetical protein